VHGLPIPLIAASRQPLPVPIFSHANLIPDALVPDMADDPISEMEHEERAAPEAYEVHLQHETREPAEEESDDDQGEEQEEEGDAESTMNAWADLICKKFVRPASRRRGIRDSEYGQKVEEVFKRFRRDAPWGLRAELAETYDVPPATVYYWYRRWVADENWRPYSHPIKSSRRIFSDAQEAEIVARLEQEFWAEERKLSTRAFRDFVKGFWVRHRSEVLRPQRFVASNKFRILFSRRNRLSLRKAILKPFRMRRDEAAVSEYVEAVSRAVAQYGPDKVMNMDETSWRDVQTRGKTLARMGWATVRVRVKGNLKAAVSAVCTVTYAGGKLPVLYVLKGRTQKTRESLRPHVPLSRVTLSDSGWMNEVVMIKYIRWLRFAMGDDACALVVDTFPGHVTARARWQFARSGIELISVPRGMTGELQPLDVSCFGPLKKISEKLWDRDMTENPELRWSHREGARLLEEAWPQLKSSTIRAGWHFCAVEPALSQGMSSRGPDTEDEDDIGHEIEDDDEFHESAVEPDSEPWDPPSDGTIMASNRRIALARERCRRPFPKLPEIDISVHELPTLVDDELGFLATQAERGSAATEASGRRSRGPRRESRRRAVRRGSAMTRGRASGRPGEEDE
jgi:hypothetical protein